MREYLSILYSFYKLYAKNNYETEQWMSEYISNVSVFVHSVFHSLVLLSLRFCGPTLYVILLSHKAVVRVNTLETGFLLNNI
jgi:hypothetical protein